MIIVKWVGLGSKIKKKFKLILVIQKFFIFLPYSSRLTPLLTNITFKKMRNLLSSIQETIGKL